MSAWVSPPAAMSRPMPTLETQRLREAMKERFAAATESVDALITPTADRRHAPRRDRPRDRARALHASRQLPRSGRPVSAQRADGGRLLMSLRRVWRGYDEATALRIGWAHGEATDWHLRRPGEMTADAEDHSEVQGNR